MVLRQRIATPLFELVIGMMYYEAQLVLFVVLMSICLPVYLFVCLSCPSICPSVRPSVRPPRGPFFLLFLLFFGRAVPDGVGGRTA